MTQPTQPAAARTRRRENTRERLLEAAVGVFVDTGLKRVTVDDLVGAAGFTRGAFYSNFTSVDEVFFEVFRRYANGMLDQVREQIAAVPDGAFGVEAVGEVLASLAGPGSPWVVLHGEFTLLALRDERAREVLAVFSREMRAQVVEVIDDVLARLGRRGSVPTDQLAQLVISLQFHAMTLGALGDTTLSDGAPQGRWLTDQVLVTLVNGFSVELADS
ncbi:MAG: TetR/AcrR family transcriptional regulator [Nocardioides sp.]|uniref:TetR/AcrR family transcriptional regulator n=1 Tax=Nocardioides sp. TaxID=35761 RepID=UPI003F00A392